MRKNNRLFEYGRGVKKGSKKGNGRHITGIRAATGREVLIIMIIIIQRGVGGVMIATDGRRRRDNNKYHEILFHHSCRIRRNSK